MGNETHPAYQIDHGSVISVSSIGNPIQLAKQFRTCKINVSLSESIFLTNLEKALWKEETRHSKTVDQSQALIAPVIT